MRMHQNNRENMVLTAGNATLHGVATVKTNAAFINLLSDGLYQNKKKAVVREILCNAWDAHIAAKISNRPVIVLMNNDSITFRDFGEGIPDDKMAKIYLEYGNSTKEDSADLTGGFGLGSKAPFAYTNSFTVVSYNAGKATTYVIQRVGSNVEQKPEILKINEQPSSETGLQVTVDFTDPKDFNEFYELVQSIAYYANVPTMLQGKVVPSYREHTEKGYFIKLVHEHNTKTVCNIIINNVAYSFPLSHLWFDNSFSEFLDLETEDLLKEFPTSHTYVPFSVYVNIIYEGQDLEILPSREGLAFSKHTVKRIVESISEIYKSFAKTFLKDVTDEITKIAHKYIDNDVPYSSYQKYLDTVIFLKEDCINKSEYYQEFIKQLAKYSFAYPMQNRLIKQNTLETVRRFFDVNPKISAKVVNKAFSNINDAINKEDAGFKYRDTQGRTSYMEDQKTHPYVYLLPSNNKTSLLKSLFLTKKELSVIIEDRLPMKALIMPVVRSTDLYLDSAKFEKFLNEKGIQLFKGNLIQPFKISKKRKPRAKTLKPIIKYSGHDKETFSENYIFEENAIILPVILTKDHQTKTLFNVLNIPLYGIDPAIASKDLIHKQTSIEVMHDRLIQKFLEIFTDKHALTMLFEFLSYRMIQNSYHIKATIRQTLTNSFFQKILLKNQILFDEFEEKRFNEIINLLEKIIPLHEVFSDKKLLKKLVTAFAERFKEISPITPKQFFSKKRFKEMECLQQTWETLKNFYHYYDEEKYKTQINNICKAYFELYMIYQK